MNITVTEKNTKDLQSRFNKLAGKVDNLVPLLKRIGVNVLNEISATFENQAWEGTAWTPLAQRTITGRRNKNKSTIKILQDTGLLRRSFIPSQPQAGDKVIIVGAGGNEHKAYAPTHELGLHGVPQRRMLPSQRRGLEIAVETTERYIAESVKEAGLKK